MTAGAGARSLEVVLSADAPDVVREVAGECAGYVTKTTSFTASITEEASGRDAPAVLAGPTGAQGKWLDGQSAHFVTGLLSDDGEWQRSTAMIMTMPARAGRVRLMCAGSAMSDDDRAQLDNAVLVRVRP
jgi:hypothetical protein